MVPTYLEAVCEDGDLALITAALNDVECAPGIPSDAQLQSGVGLDAVILKMQALGLELTAKAT